MVYLHLFLKIRTPQTFNKTKMHNNLTEIFEENEREQDSVVSESFFVGDMVVNNKNY